MNGGGVGGRGPPGSEGNRKGGSYIDGKLSDRRPQSEVLSTIGGQNSEITRGQAGSGGVWSRVTVGGLDMSSSEDMRSESGVPNDGLNPDRQHGFLVQPAVGVKSQRFETPSLNQLRARQSAIVSKFMTFFKRKSK